MRFAFTVLALALAALPALAGPIPGGGVLEFKILRNGGDFGMHRVSFSTDEAGRTVVDISIAMRAGLGPITLFSYEHANREVWEGDRIISLVSETDDDGDVYAVQAQWGENKVAVEHQDGAYQAPAGAYSTSYWNPVMLSADQLVNTQKGHIEEITIQELGSRSMTFKGEARAVKGYAIDASVPITVWYDSATNQWAGLDFKVRGSDISYRRLTPFESP